MIRCTAAQLDAIRKHGEADFPHECCGVMIGHFAAAGGVGGDGVNIKTVHELLPISNSREDSAKHNRFLISPEELLKAERHARAAKQDVLGFYHSHPDHPAIPSQFDLDHAWPIYSYIIVSIMQGRSTDLTSWELRTDRSRFDAEEIQKGP